MQEFIEALEVCHFRSRLNELPLQLKRDIALVTLQDGWNNIKRRDEILQLLNNYHISYKDIGTGTNRFIIKYDGYALKIALDMEGVNDNKQEWNIGYQLPRISNLPDIALPYEISKGGHLLVADYAPAYTSFTEMTNNKNEINKILSNWANAGFLLGDVGIINKNFANWGKLNGKPVCIDYAYIFKASGTIFGCNRCGCKELTLDNTFSNYYCPSCKNQFPDALLRARISDNSRAMLFEESLKENLTVTMKEAETDIECMVKKPVEYNPDAPHRTEGFWNALQMKNALHK